MTSQRSDARPTPKFFLTERTVYRLRSPPRYFRSISSIDCAFISDPLSPFPLSESLHCELPPFSASKKSGRLRFCTLFSFSPTPDGLIVLETPSKDCSELRMTWPISLKKTRSVGRLAAMMPRFCSKLSLLVHMIESRSAMTYAVHIWSSEKLHVVSVQSLKVAYSTMRTIEHPVAL